MHILSNFKLVSSIILAEREGSTTEKYVLEIKLIWRPFCERTPFCEIDKTLGELWEMKKGLPIENVLSKPRSDERIIVRSMET